MSSKENFLKKPIENPMHFEVCTEEDNALPPQRKATPAKEETVRVACDTYLFFSLALPDIFTLMMATVKELFSIAFGQKERKPLQNESSGNCFTVTLRIIWVVIMFFVFLALEISTLIPACITPLFQIMFVVYLNQEIETRFTQEENNFAVIYQLKTVVIFIFLFSLTKEITQGVNSLIYTFSKAKSKFFYFVFLSFVPQAFQIAMAFLISWYSIELILVNTTAYTLILTFAGLTLIIDLDERVAEFFRDIDFYEVLFLVKKIVEKLTADHENIHVYEKILMKDVWEQKEVKLELSTVKSKHPHIKVCLLVLKYVGIVAIFIVSLVFYWIQLNK